MKYEEAVEAGIKYCLKNLIQIMETKEIKIIPPEGMEIDRENSTHFYMKEKKQRREER